MNERIKQVRKTLGLSGEKFGSKLGVTRTAISLIESGKNNLTEQNIKSICREFNVSEEWLRNGTGEMFISTDNISIDDLITSNKADDIELEILKAYFSLDKEVRKKAIEHFKATLLD